MADAPAELYLKLENLQPIGAFKVRGGVNLVSRLDDAERRNPGMALAGAYREGVSIGDAIASGEAAAARVAEPTAAGTAGGTESPGV